MKFETFKSLRRARVEPLYCHTLSLEEPGENVANGEHWLPLRNLKILCLHECSVLPAELADMPKLSIVRISKPIERLPEALFKLLRLQCLDFDNATRTADGKINRKLLSELARFETLPELWLELTPDHDVLAAMRELGVIEKVRSVRLSSAGARVPASLGFLSHAETIKLWQKPAANAQSQKLEGPLVLPDTIRELVRLKSLSLGDSGWLEFPDTLRSLHGLEELELGGIQSAEPGDARRLPRWLTEFSRLRRLETRWDQIRLAEIPEWLDDLPNLEDLRVTSLLQKYPSVISRLRNLRALALRIESGYPVQPIAIPDDAFAELTRLEELDLWIGSKTIPSSISGLSKLKRLNLQLEPAGFDQLPSDFNRLEALENLRLSLAAGTNGSLLYQALSLPHLQQLDVWVARGQMQLPLPDNIALRLPRLTELSAFNWHCGSLPESFGELQHLRKLSLSNAAVALPESASKLKALEELRIILAKDSPSPDWFSELTNLRIAELENYPFRTLPSFAKLKRLQEFAVLYGKLECLPDDIDQAKALVEIKIQGELKSLPDAITSLPALARISVDSGLGAAGMQKINALRARLSAQLVAPELDEDSRLARSVCAELERLGARIASSPPVPAIAERKRVTCGGRERKLPEALRQLFEDVTWPANAQFRGQVGRKELWCVEFGGGGPLVGYSTREPYWVIGTYDGGNYMLLASLDAEGFDDPWIGVLDHEDFEAKDVSELGSLSELLSKLSPETRAAARDARS